MTNRESKEGQKIPQVELAEMSDGKLQRLGSRELFAARRVILFALPGAFTPTCSTAHVPGYVALVHLGDELSMQGVKAASGGTTVPQVFIEGRLVGGADQLVQHLETR